MIAAIITRGYGTFGSIAQVMCAGYFVSVAPRLMGQRVTLQSQTGVLEIRQ